MRHGLTLTELIVVIAIISIMLGATVPAVSHYLPGIQLSGVTRTLSSKLRETQEKSITEQKQYLIRFYPATSPAYYEMIRINSGVEELQEKINLPSTTSITLDPAITDNQIIFSADGGPSSSGNITLSVNSNNKIINVSPAGFIKVL